ncbi:MAG TPA: hypothetical protein VFW88_08740 [Burkholderiales bacterium]|nr:hypothetical protein [Burkholderiales bacterium]
MGIGRPNDFLFRRNLHAKGLCEPNNITDFLHLLHDATIFRHCRKRRTSICRRVKTTPFSVNAAAILPDRMEMLPQAIRVDIATLTAVFRCKFPVGDAMTRVPAGRSADIRRAIGPGKERYAISKASWTDDTKLRSRR